MSKEENEDLWKYWDIYSINNLNEEEVLSLLKSNVIPYRIRNVIRVKLCLDNIKALSPIIITVIVAGTLVGIIKKAFEKQEGK